MREVLNGGSHQASYTRQSTIKLDVCRADWLGDAVNEQHTRGSNAEGQRGHQASCTKRLALKSHTCRADWLGLAAIKQHQREQC